VNKKKAPSITMIGGGTGSYALLSILKDYVQDITALVNMVDSGGSTGKLRDELGTLPTGDVRQCLVALSRSTQTMRDLFSYRFDEGSFDGHSFGNVFLTAVEKLTDNFAESVELASKVLDIQGKVVPITLENVHLVLEDKSGKKIKGEVAVGSVDLTDDDRPKLSLEPNAKINPDAKESIMRADIVVIAPGNLYRSLVPTLLVDGVAEALMTTSAKVIYVCNLMSDEKQTKGYTVHSFVSELERFIGPDAIDMVLYNTAEPDKELVKKYADASDEVPVVYDESESIKASYEAKGSDLISSKVHETVESDKLKRTFIRHDGDAVARQLMKIFYS